jgi:hypothetical protein
MADAGPPGQPPYHLLLEEAEVLAARTALNLLLDDERRAPAIRPHAREALAALEARPDASGIVTAELTPPQMKVTHTAVMLLFDETRREQADEREALRGILEKLPDEHTMRAIRL